MSVISLKTCQKIEKHLFLYQKINAAIAEAQAAALYGTSNRDKSGGGGHAFVSDPTAQRACQLADPVARVVIDEEVIRRPETWLKIIEVTRDRYKGTLIGEMMDRRYLKNQDIMSICMDMHIDRSTYFDWRQNIVTFAALAACQAGTLKVYE